MICTSVDQGLVASNLARPWNQLLGAPKNPWAAPALPPASGHGPASCLGSKTGNADPKFHEAIEGSYKSNSWRSPAEQIAIQQAAKQSPTHNKKTSYHMLGLKLIERLALAPSGNNLLSSIEKTKPSDSKSMIYCTCQLIPNDMSRPRQTLRKTLVSSTLLYYISGNGFALAGRTIPCQRLLACVGVKALQPRRQARGGPSQARGVERGADVGGARQGARVEGIVVPGLRFCGSGRVPCFSAVWVCWMDRKAESRGFLVIIGASGLQSGCLPDGQPWTNYLGKQVLYYTPVTEQILGPRLPENLQHQEAHEGSCRYSGADSLDLK